MSALAVFGVLVTVAVAGTGSAAGKKRAKRHLRAQTCTRVASATGKANVVRCPTGTTGPQGAAGPPGPTGAPGPVGTQDIVIPRTIIPFTTNFMTDGGNVQNLAKVGPIHLDGLCRRTFAPGKGGGSKAPTHPDPRLPTTGGESEAQILVWTETGSLSFKGQVGPRKDIPPGPPDYTAETYNPPPPPPAGKVGAGTDQPVKDPVAGEGDHLFVAASNENTDEIRATDPASDNPGPDVASGKVVGLSEYPAFNYATGIIGTSDGHLVKADLMGGFDVLGVYGECVFAGVVSPLT